MIVSNENISIFPGIPSRVSNGLNPDKTRRSIGSDLGPNCL